MASSFSQLSAQTSQANNKSYSWLPMGLCAALIIYKYILQVSPSIIVHELMQEFHLDGVRSGHLSAAFLYALMVTQLFVGYWLDRYPLIYLMTIASTFCTIGAIGFSFASTVHIAQLARILMGIGGAFAAAGYFKIASILVQPKYFAFVSGLLATAVTLGMIIGQIALSSLMQYTHWRYVILGCGIFGLLLSIMFASLLKVHKGIYKKLLTQKVKHVIDLSDIKIILKNRQNWLLSLYHGLAFAPIGLFAGLWGMSFLKQAILIDHSMIPFLSACTFLGFGIGSPLIGLLADQYMSKKNLMMGNGVLSLCIVTCILYYPFFYPVVMGLLLFLLGLTSSAFMLGFVLGKNINPIYASATAVTFLNTGGVAITAITEPLIGRLLDVKWDGTLKEGIPHFNVTDYQFALSILPAYLILALILLYFIREVD